MMDCFVEAYPWDLMPADVDAVLGRLRGEAGITGLAVWAACRPVATLRCRDWEPRVFRSRGGLYFEPFKDAYERTRCRPLVSSWTHDGERFDRIAAACDRHGLHFRVMTSAAAAGRLAEHYPEFAAKNALGVESSISLCLSNPDVQEYLAAMVRDISGRYRISGLALTDFAVRWFEATEKELAPGFLNDVGREVLALCFCNECRLSAEHAGVDFTDAAARARRIIELALREGLGPECSLENLLAENPSLAEHRRLQNERLNGLLRNLAGGQIEVFVCRDEPSAMESAVGGLDVSIAAGLITRPKPGSQPKPSHAARRNEIRVPASQAVGQRGAEFVAGVRQAAVAGVSGLHVDHLGLLGEPAMESLRQALRFARRTS